MLEKLFKDLKDDSLIIPVKLLKSAKFRINGSTI